jgi:hypothetical protein
MPAPTSIPGDLQVAGNLFAAAMTIPPGSVTNSNVAANAQIASSKLVCQRTVSQQLFADATAIVAVSQNITLLAGASGTIRDFNAWITTVATGSDRAVTVDLQKSTGGGAFSTICSATIGFNNASSALTLVPAVITSTGLVSGDLLKVVVTVAGSSAAQALGLSVALRYDEAY